MTNDSSTPQALVMPEERREKREERREKKDEKRGKREERREKREERRDHKKGCKRYPNLFTPEFDGPYAASIRLIFTVQNASGTHNHLEK